MEKSPRAMEGGSASSPVLRRRESHRALGSLSAPRSGASFLCEEQQQPRHFLDACFLCRRTLRASSDVFMYRGDTPFCSEVCRQEQIKLDEAEEREMRRRRRRHHRQHASPVEQPASSAQVAAEAVVAG